MLRDKIVLLSGPRQVGKTTLSRNLTNNLAYYNFDVKKDALVFLNQEWDREKSLVVFDELHKMPKWKLWLKGLYDEGDIAKQQILVTGSAKLDTLRRVGDSLAGRHYSLRLWPLDLKELRLFDKNFDNSESAYESLLDYGGFPEPFLKKSQKFYGLWKKSHFESILRQDLISLERIRDIDQIELLVELLSTRVGSTVSANSLAEDLDRSEKTIRNWLDVLERMYLIFSVSPISKNIARGLKKAKKFYFYDVAQVRNGEGAKLENLVALSLKKELDFLSDTEGLRTSLNYVRTKDGLEIDFVTQVESERRAFEVKLSDGAISKSLQSLGPALKGTELAQLVKNLDREYSNPEGVRVRNVLKELTYLDLRPKGSRVR